MHRGVRAVRILITNVQLNHRSGTEIVVRDLEAELRRRGHEVCVYAEYLGLISDEITANGGHVVASLDAMPFVPDVIHGHHNATATTAAVHFPTTPVILVCHSRNFWIDMARGVPSVHRYVAVDLNCRERLVAEGIAESSIDVITNAVDLERFVFRPECAAPPRRAAVFGNNAHDGGFVTFVRAACAQLGIDLDEFGSGIGRTEHHPELVLAGYDLVFAKARCAIEAMAAGCAVIAVDEAGYGGLVTADVVDQMLDWNVGDRCLQRAHDVAAIVADIDRVVSDDAARVSVRVRERCDLRRAAFAYEQHYLSAVAAGPPTTGPAANWHDAHRDVLTFANELECRLRVGEGAWSMPPLPPSVGDALHLAAHGALRRVAPGERYSVEVEIRNHSREQLSTVGSTPVLLSYQWLHPETGAITVANGERSALTRAIAPGQVHHQSMVVVAPVEPGEYSVRVTLVQESVMWLSDLAKPVFVDLPVTVGRPADEWLLSGMARLASIRVASSELTHAGAVANLGFVSSPMPAMLTFATAARFLDAAVRVGCAAVIVPAGLASAVPEGLGVLIADDPAAVFWRLHEALVKRTDFYGRDEPTSIHPSAHVHATASIDRNNVVIGAEASIGAGCVITGRVRIGDRVSVGAGSVLGASGFQTARIDDRLVEFTHAGSVVIEDDAAVFANATIARGLFRQATVVGASARVGNNAFVSHNSRIGPDSVVGHGAVVNGNVEVGVGVWIGPGARVSNNITLGDGARIDLGATVIGSLAAGEHVGGPPAIDHRSVLREVASWRSRSRRR